FVSGAPLSAFGCRPSDLDTSPGAVVADTAYQPRVWWTQSPAGDPVTRAPETDNGVPLSTEVGALVLDAAHRPPPSFDDALQRVLTLVVRICEALGYLHGEGLVHCDLKPANVVVANDLQPILVDFGLATRNAGTGRDFLEVSQSGAGTIAYMSPEQVTGEVLDARTDLYALGCMFYELLTGQPPFDVGTPLVTLHNH